jgi:hypothetical protein
VSVVAKPCDVVFPCADRSEVAQLFRDHVRHGAYQLRRALFVQRGQCDGRADGGALDRQCLQFATLDFFLDISFDFTPRP